MKNFLTILFFLTFGLVINAQPYETNPDFNRTRNWHFGNGVGLRFDLDTIQMVHSSIQTHEAAAVHTDQDGNLLLYSNGEKIWNANHEVIHNGNLSLGHHSSNSGSVFVFHEDNPDSVYLFNTYYNISSTKEFSVNLVVREADTFRVAYKDSVLMYNVCEAIAVVKAGNGKDVWVVVHGFEANNIYSYLLTAQGIITCPAISKSFSTPTGSPQSAFFDMIISSNGKYMVRVNTNQTFPIYKRVEVYSFNSNKGEFDFLFTIDSLEQIISGISFNKDNSYLFITERDGDLNLFKFNPNDSLSTVNSVKKISLTGLKTKMQIMPYEYGIALIRIDPLNYVDFIIQIIESDSFYVLEKKININYSFGFVPPNFNQSYYYSPSINFIVKLNCVYNTIQFYGQDTFFATSHDWLINKQGATSITADTKTPLIQFSDTGIYEVRYIASNGVRSDTIIKTVNIFPKINQNFLGNDTGWCENLGGSITLQAPNGMHCYEWSNGSTGRTIAVDTTGVYWAKIVTSNFCVLYDTITIVVDTVPDVPEIYRDNDTLKTNVFADIYRWYRDNTVVGSNDPRLVITDTGIYKLQIRTFGGCTAFSDTVHVPVDTLIDNVNTVIFDGIKIYPNPFENKLIVSNQNDEEAGLKIYDINGKVIYNEKLTNIMTINTDTWAAGIYLIKLTSLEGHIQTYKLIKL